MSFKRAFSLPELLLVLTLFSLASALIFHLLHDGFRKFRAIHSKNDTQQKMSKALSWMQRDLEKADSDQIGMKRIGTPGNGDVIWFLSADDPTQGNPELRYVRDPASGMPRWQRHIIYYLIRPAHYSKISGGYNAAIDPDPRGDYFAPHKFLIRKVVNRSEHPEKLMTSYQVDAFVTAPADRDISALAAEAQVENCKLVADNLLSLEGTRYDRTLEIDLRAVHIERANATLPMGGISLKVSPYTENQRLRVVLKR
ncbi:MAG: prepilin-type N-terminal cleavage/methylation domain-containing protein [Candidatus Eremiobacteraeota bacterium]|nr:prepilin-type N-terminal cleavage/methylation domain-containing protein [Candidatus Eremiobacteraeota bacterium]